MYALKPALLVLASILIAGCGAKQVPPMSEGHIGMDREPTPAPAKTGDSTADKIPPPVIRAPVLPPPATAAELSTYTVIVNEVPLKELLFALARDAKLNLDVYDDIEGTITINAIDQTLPQILDRIGKQTNIRYQIEGNNLVVAADKPFLRTYKVSYLNLSRTSTGRVDVSTQIAASGTADVSGGGSNSGGSNNSVLNVVNDSQHSFWRTLFVNIASIIGDSRGQRIGKGDALIGESVVVNAETGLISIRATSKQHVDVQKFIDEVVNSAQRQVLIEATIAEVNLNNTYQAGVDWSRLANNLNDGFSLEQQLLGGNLNAAPTLVLSYADQEDDFNVSASVRLLEQFGDVKVLSSPKIMALNNQTSILKVVDNRVYFTIEVETSQNQVSTITNFETDVRTVPVGLVMSLIPFISDSGEVLLNIRPTISRILQFVNDPNPALANAGVISQIPEIQVREMESVLRLNNNQVAIIGGLMQDSIDKDTDAVPGVSRIPGVGEAFKFRNDQVSKTELVIFLRTTVIKEPSLDGDLKHFKKFLPAPAQASGTP